MADEPEIAYSVKELIKGLSDRIDGFMNLMASKADQASVAQAHLRIDAVDTRLANVEHTLSAEEKLKAAEDKHNSSRREFRRWIIPIVLSAATTVVLVLQVFHL